ncbi:MAG TPA: glycoside hydrolase family 38 C-terminal domain-containing protein [Ilumatobacteraceae bacterium]
MHNDLRLVEARIRRELAERVLPAVYSASIPLTVAAWDAPGEPVPFEQAIAGDYIPFVVGDHWSRPWGTTWFRFSVDVPPEMSGPQLEAVIDLGFHPDAAGFQSEGLVWIDGRPIQGIHPRRRGLPLPDVGPGPFTFFVEAASNPAFPGFRSSPLGSLATAGAAPLYRLRHATLCTRDDEAFQLLLDVDVLLGLAAALPPEEARRTRLMRQLESAFDVLDLGDVGANAPAARRLLREPLQLTARAGAHRVVAVGHAHIDSAWLWPIRETQRKCLRTFSSALRLMDDYPDYHFSCSQAAQYEWIESSQPQVFQRIREKVAGGQWHPVGGMWVEPDMNLPSGESIVRQLVTGQRYFESRFGSRSSVVWIPDVFGYPATLPQVFVQGGCSRFVTQKLSWNKQNVFPHSTFWWEGVDGSRVLTHFPPVDTYNAELTAAEVRYAETNFKDHGWSNWSLMPFGHGNGGGGPTREMMERARRMADLDGASPITVGTPEQFFGHVEAEAAAGAPVPVWSGELYFEMHRGTLTSQAATKTGNRRCERLLREAELWWAAAGDAPNEVTAELDSLWKDVLLQQFHDIIPGSSIAWVAADAKATHDRVADRLESLAAEALATVAPAGPVVANAGTHARREVIVADGEARMAVAPGCGFGTFVDAGPEDRVVVTERSMTNGLLAVNWNLDGEITSIIDVERGRELLSPGRRIALELAPDHPVEYDAWDLESWTARLGEPVALTDSVKLDASGPLIADLVVCRRFGRSQVTQSYTMRAGSARLDITFDLDWHEDEKLLSLVVPLDVHAREATCEVQFGHVKRPTHASTSWDAAKFEVCAHRFVDLSEPSFGVAVMNDGRYGHNVQGGGVRVSLLRAPKYPDPDADHGRHRLTISVLPHGPGLHDVLGEAEALNLPLRVVTGQAAAMPAPVITIDHPGVQISSVKRADDGSGDLVVRLYEACGDRAVISVRTPFTIGSASKCNLLEEPQQGIECSDGIVSVTLRPFELVTLRLAPRDV